MISGRLKRIIIRSNLLPKIVPLFMLIERLKKAIRTLASLLDTKINKLIQILSEREIQKHPQRLTHGIH